MKWITYNNSSIDQLSCAWLIIRFVDPRAEILFSDKNEFDGEVEKSGAVPFEVEGVEFSSTQDYSAFERMLIAYRFTNGALDAMSKMIGFGQKNQLGEMLKKIGREDLVPMLEVEVGEKSQVCLEKAIAIYDAIYSWCKEDTLKKPFVPRLKIDKAI